MAIRTTNPGAATYPNSVNFKTVVHELRRIRTTLITTGGSAIVGFSTEAKQDVSIIKLQEIIDKVDFELIESLGIDTDILTTLILGTITSDSLGIGGGTAPVITTITSSSFSYLESNQNYAILIPIVSGYPTTGIVNIFLVYESIAPTPGTNGSVFTLSSVTAGVPSFLTSVISTPFGGGVNTQIIQLSFDTTGLTYDSLRIHIQFNNIISGFPANYRVTTLGTTPLNYALTDLITRVDRYENNLLTSTTYLDVLDLPYTLIGLFIRDSNKATEQKLSTILTDIDNKVSTKTNQLTQIDEARATTNFLSNQEAAVVKFADIESGITPIFPFNVTQLGVMALTVIDTQSIIPIIVNNMTELATLWNNHISALKMMVLSANNFKLIPGTHTLPTEIVDSIIIHDGVITLRTWKAAVFIPTVVDESVASSTDKTVEQLRRSFLLEQYANWEFLKGNEKLFTYYTGIVAGNPSGNTSNIETIRFRNATLTYITQTLTYDINDNILNIITT